MKSIWIGLFVTLFLVGHVHASPGGHGGEGGSMKNPYREGLEKTLKFEQKLNERLEATKKRLPENRVINLFEEYDKLSTLEQALNKVTYKGEHLTESQRTRFYKALNNNPDYDVIVEQMGHNEALTQMVIRSSPEGSSSIIKLKAKSLRLVLQSLMED